MTEMNDQLSLKNYSPFEVEKKWQEKWESLNAFSPNPDDDGEPFCVVIPPPNVTGSLHMGHAFNTALIDVVVRFQRLLGKNVLCLPGTDHASIAVQTILDKQLKSEGKTSEDIGRDEFLKREINGFNTKYIQNLWEIISKIEQNNLGLNYLNELKQSNSQTLQKKFSAINLISLLADYLAINIPDSSNKINNFVNPNELFLTLLNNPKDNLLGTLSLLEKYNSLKRCRHLIESWGSQRLKTLENCISILIDNPSSGLSETNKEIDDLFKDLNSDAIKFQELYYLERQHINFLDKQRCGNFIAS